jgi:hypothetical protein
MNWDEIKEMYDSFVKMVIQRYKGEAHNSQKLFVNIYILNFPFNFTYFFME